MGHKRRRRHDERVNGEWGQLGKLQWERWKGGEWGVAAWQLLRQLKDTSCLQPVCYKGRKRGKRWQQHVLHTHAYTHTHTHTSSFAYVWYLGKLSLRSSVSFCILCGLPRKRKHTHTLINSNSHTQREKPLIDWAAKVAAKGQRQGQTHSGTKTKDSKFDAITLG